MRLRSILLGLGIAFLCLALAVGGLIWRGTPIKVASTPAPVPGTIYFLWRDRDDLLKVMQQPADLSAPPVRVAARERCPESNCNIVGLRLQAGEVEYAALHQDEFYWWRAGLPVAKVTPDELVARTPEGASNEQGSLVVAGEVVLPYRGQYHPKFASGYRPVGWISDGDYLIFYYNGYTNGLFSILGGMLGHEPAGAGTYLWERQTGQIYPFADGHDYLWVPQAP